MIAFYWGCFMSLNPYAMKLIIDAVVKAGPAGENLLPQVMRPALFYVALSASLGIVFRAYDWIVLRSLPQMEVEITAAMFAYVEGLVA